jgi:hypothetical protein
MARPLPVASYWTTPGWCPPGQQYEGSNDEQDFGTAHWTTTYSSDSGRCRRTHAARPVSRCSRF